jgi:hypothetical protein
VREQAATLGAVMEPIQESMKARLEKRLKLLEKGIDPYGGSFEVSETVAAAWIENRGRGHVTA